MGGEVPAARAAFWAFLFLILLTSFPITKFKSLLLRCGHPSLGFFLKRLRSVQVED